MAALVEHLLLYVAIMQPLNALVFVGDGIGQVPHISYIAAYI